jgi:hypothetical protein
MMPSNNAFERTVRHRGPRLVQDGDTGLVLQVLEPIWTTKAETASRVRSRIENILDWAKARGYRSGENPSRWKGHLNQLLPTISTKHRVKHHKAMPFPEVGAFALNLRGLNGVAGRYQPNRK